MAAPIVSQTEERLAKALQRHGLRVSRQVSVPSPSGNRPFLLDFALMDARVDIEVDGPHHDAPAQRSKDEYRDRWLRRHGWRVIRIPASAVHDDPDAVAARLVRILDQGGHTGVFAWPLMMLRRAWGNRGALLIITTLLLWLSWTLFTNNATMWKLVILFLCIICVVFALRVTRLDYLQMGAGGLLRRRKKPFSLFSDIAVVLLLFALFFGALALLS